MAVIDKTMYKEIVKNWATGIAIVTSRLGTAEANGMVATSICSVSAERPLFLVCVDKEHKTHAFISEEKVFTVNFLAEDQAELSDIFCQPGTEKTEMLAKISRTSDTNGCQIINDCLAYLDCEVVAVYDAINHTIFVGKVVGGSILREAKPLVYFSRQYLKAA